jgi:hypothetical protein
MVPKSWMDLDGFFKGKSIGKSHPKTNMDDNYDNWGYPSYLRTPPYTVTTRTKQNHISLR